MNQRYQGYSNVAAPAGTVFGVSEFAPPAVGGGIRNDAGLHASERQRTSAEVIEMKRALLTRQRELRIARQQVNSLTAANTRLRRELLQRAQREAEVESLAYCDELTRLPNRRVLLDRLTQAIARSERQNSKVALLWLDLDGFKGVNDWLGHAAGDDLLRQVGERLAAGIRASDTACRYGGDEFAVMLSDLEEGRSVDAVAAKIRARLCSPYVVDECEIRITVSLGSAVFPEDGHTPDDLMKRADAAMYRCKPAHRDISMTPLVLDHLEARRAALDGTLSAQGVDLR